jgi:hypothetical protein
MVVNAVVIRAMIVTQSEDRSIIYFATVLANEMYTLQAPAIGFNAIVVQAMHVTKSEDSFFVYFATVFVNEV